MTFKCCDEKYVVMRISLPLNKASGKIVAIRIDGKMSYNYAPEYIPYGVKNIVIDVNDVLITKGDHIIELITEKGDYIKAKFSV
ncbi:hypothetical protein [Saccharolobus caldissimus]|jgi:hypothetical protein|uniref:Uncharacterized protein n=2 Tax=Saccharolobus TaxID=2100760 RepID=A0AAQ4CTP1_9CREN|nr:hypothetical protein [Saccharolobus caldissimus]BDB99172.1 hypothetical protein SACC_21890 [Saccharolobus caldissimus]